MASRTKRGSETASQPASKAEKFGTNPSWDYAALKIIHERAPIGLYAVDRELRFVRINEYLANLNGIRAAEHVGRTVREVVPELADQLEPWLLKVLHSGEAVTDVVGSWLAAARPGKESAKISSYYPVKEESGATIGVAAIVSDVTEEMQIRGALREREGRYRLLFEQSNDAVFVFPVTRDGNPGNFLEANEVACRMLGYSREELLGMSPKDFRDDVPDPNRLLREAVARGRSIFERIIRTKTGVRLPVEISATAFESRGELRILASVRDISERKRSEARLRSSLDLNEQILSSAQEGIVVVDRDIRVVTWNAYMARLTGVAPQAAIGQNVFDLFPWLRGSVVEKLSERALAGECISGVEFSDRKKGQDKPRWLLISTGPLQSNEGYIAGTLTTVRDITDQKAIDAELGESTELNRAIIRATGEGIAVCDRELNLRMWNPGMENISGMPPERVLGKNPLDVFPFLRRQGLDEAFDRVLRGEAISIPDIKYDIPETKKHGWAIGMLHPLRNPANEVAGILIDVREITERKKREEDLRRLSYRLLRSQDEERRRIARDLHDNFAQRVLGVKLNLTQIVKASARLDARSKKLLADTKSLVDGWVKEIRSLSYILHPPLLDELGLRLAIAQLAEGFEKRTGIQVSLEISPRLGRLPQEQEIALFRVIQESLTNIQRHSGSKKATIRLEPDQKNLMLEVTDRGTWKGSKAAKRTDTGGRELGVGILGMRERMRQLGGSLEIIWGRKGTTVRAELPQARRSKRSATSLPTDGSKLATARLPVIPSSRIPRNR